MTDTLPLCTFCCAGTPVLAKRPQQLPDAETRVVFFKHVGHTPRFSGERERPREHRPWNYVTGDLLFLPVAGTMG